MVEPSRRVPVAPGRLPLIGHGLQLMRQPLDFLAALPEQGDLVEIRLGPTSAYVVCSPELVNQMLLDARTFDKGGPLIDKTRRLVGDGLVNSLYTPHRRQRRLMQPAFHRDRIRGYAMIMRNEVAAVLASWQDGAIIDVGAKMYEITARTTARTMFSADSARSAVAEAGRSLPIVVNGIYWRILAPVAFIHRLPTPANRRYEQAVSRLHTAIDEMIDSYRSADVDHQDLLSMLLADDDGDGSLSDSEVHDQVITIFLAGTETTATLLSWALHLLGEHPDIAGQVRAEVDTALGSHELGWEDLPRLDLTRRVITETLRLYPPAWLFTRSATVDTALGGYSLQAGSILLYSPYLLHRQAENFEGPDRFDPARWLPSGAATRSKKAFTAFGSGPRQCIGDIFGTTEAVIALAMIMAKWRCSPVPGTAVRPHPRATLQPGHVPMRIHHR